MGWSVISLCRFTYTINTGTEEFIQHIVLIGSNDQLRDWQAHHASNMARTNITEVTRRHSERHLLFIASRRRQIAAEVVHHLRHHTRPVNRIDRADF